MGTPLSLILLEVL